MAFHISSPSFKNQAPIPRDFSREGKDKSPQLEWGDAPPQTRSFALIVDDPDAPQRDPWVHWVIYNIPSSVHGLPENMPKGTQPSSPHGVMQGKNSWNEVGYDGPLPPPGHGTHHYHFHLYALDQELPLKPGASKEQLKSAMAHHVVGETEMVGTYRR